MSRKTGQSLQKEAPWRASTGSNPIPKIHYSPIVKVPNNPTSLYAVSIIREDNPIGKGFASEAIVESAGPDCIVPGQVTPIRLLGLKVWPIEVDFKFLEPVGRELKLIGKFMDSAVKIMDRSFSDN